MLVSNADLLLRTPMLAALVPVVGLRLMAATVTTLVLPFPAAVHRDQARRVLALPPGVARDSVGSRSGDGHAYWTTHQT